MTVNGSIKGFQKGTLYLQHVQDTNYITLDSLVMNSTTDFRLGCSLDQIEMLYLSLSEDINADRISFFGSNGETQINTTLKHFKYDAQIEGGPQQELLESYYKNINLFKEQRLKFIEEKLNAQLKSDVTLANEIQLQIDNVTRRSYLYSINFAINNKNSEVAPYIALSEVYNANVKYLDTINSVLPKNIADSKYGIILEDYINKIKSE
tara:strand:- start:249 stop:872 length:624 start_codon:yes stop_codon:yes gene_type:complete